MSLSAGARLGPYEIQSAIGAGGMGEIYKARDTRLDRTVAIKILSEALTADRAFRERFEREARLISQLDHPNICALYDVGEDHGTSFLVMPYLEGQTLAKRLERGALPLSEALTIATQIASALDRAHRAGIVHRDLKPGNIILTKTGAKLLDFGLAKTTSQVATGITGPGLSGMETTAPVTGQGTLLGTFQYMAPEQLEGHPADARSDLFAFGAVLYEMLTGKRAFEGHTQASLIAAILEHQPVPPSTLQKLTPQALDHIVGTCLAKDPDERWQSAGDLVRQLTWISGHSDGAAEASQSASRHTRRGRSLWVSAALVVGLIVGAALGIASARRSGDRPAGERQVVRALVDVAPAESLQASAFDRGDNRGRPVRMPFAISPDGRSIVFSAVSNGRQQLYIRSVNELEAKPIVGTVNRAGLVGGPIP